MQFGKPKKHVKIEPIPGPTPEPLTPEEEYITIQEGGVPWVFRLSDVKQRVINLTAKAGAIDPGDEPEDTESEEWSAWKQATDKKDFYLTYANSFQWLVTETKKLDVKVIEKL